MVAKQFDEYYNICCACGEFYDSAVGVNDKIIDGTSYPQCPTCSRTEGIANITPCNHTVIKKVKTVEEGDYESVHIVACADCGTLWKRCKFDIKGGSRVSIFLSVGEARDGYEFTTDEAKELLC